MPLIRFHCPASVVSVLSNFSIDDVGNNLIGVETRRKKTNGNGRDRSTSSSSGEKSKQGSKEKSVETSLDMTSDETDSSSGRSGKKNDKNKYVPKSTEERKGWRKWHRKCTPCPNEMVLKWRDPQVKWICGGYQRARRSFKSDCLMRYRNCQDGTMFVKLYTHRCQNDTDKMDQPHGKHFFYDYKASLSDDSSSSKGSSSSTELSSSSARSSRSSSSEDSYVKRRGMGHKLRAGTSDNSMTAAKRTNATTTNIKI